jgi:mRNA interferase YafQ
MKKVSQTRQFSRDVKRMRKRGKNLEKLQGIVKLLAEGAPLPANYRDHPLTGPWQLSRDCHIEADWILIYTATGDSLRLERTGTHSDLFKK